MESLGFKLREEAILAALTEEVIKSSDIEGEQLEKAQVRSSVARKLGMDVAGLVDAERQVDAIVEILVDATQNYDQPLDAQRLFAWQSALFPSAFSGLRKIRTGGWRLDLAGPMSVISGPVGREKIHFQAPDADRLTDEMARFLTWFNQKKPTDPVISAAIAHLWFVTIHPFDDGNGRIARAITDMALAQSENSAQRFYSMSSQIRAERHQYYDILEATQKGDLDITTWLLWFLDCLNHGFDRAEEALNIVLAKARFWEKIKDTTLNARQKTIINRLLDGFEGKLTTSKWGKLAKCSQDTAARDIADLMEKNILRKAAAGGRSTHYMLIIPAN